MTRTRATAIEQLRRGWELAGTGARTTAIRTIADYHAQPPHVDRSAGERRPARASARPLVSVVTPVWNGARTLERTIASVEAQTYPAIEHIVIDGGSRDGTLDILRAHSKGPGLWLSEPDRGLYDAINKGIALAAGEHVKILNADDVLPEDAIELAVEAATRHAGVCCVRGNLEIIDDDDRVLRVVTYADRPWFLPDFFPILHPSWLLPRRVYEQLGLYATEYRVAADWEYFLRLHGAGLPIVHVDRVLARFRHGGLSGGYGGLPETYEINARYLGRGRAAVMLACMASLKAAADAATRTGVKRWLRPASAS